MDSCNANGKTIPAGDRHSGARRFQRAGRLRWHLAFLALLPLLLFACDLIPPTRLVQVEVTRLVTPVAAQDSAELTRPAVVTATPESGSGPNATNVADLNPPGVDLPASNGATESNIYTEIVDTGPLTLDPVLARDQASMTIVRNVMETLVYPHPYDPGGYAALLATGWRISNNGRTYTFSVRRGVRFSDGSMLTPADVAYSLQRFLLASPSGGPQHLLLEPVLGPDATDIVAGIDDGAYVGDRAALLANAPASTLLTVCQQLQSAIVPNDGAGTLTIHLAQPWGPFLGLMSQTWTSVMDREWAVRRGAWDGSCETWQNWYALSNGESALATAILGTGPYILDYWAPGAEYMLVANDDYWRLDSAMWEGGPSGMPDLRAVRVQQISDANMRWELLERGEVATAMLSTAGVLLAERQAGASCDWQSRECQPTASPNAPLRRISNIPLWGRQALFFNFAIPTGENDFLGSGQLDGDGIPPEFFHDEHVRKAFAYCLDDGAFVDAGLDGSGILPQGLVPPFIRRITAEPSDYPFDLQRCGVELSLAWDGALPGAGFRLQLPFESGDLAQQAVAVLLQNSLRAVNPAYRVEIVGLPRPLYQQALNERRPPLALLQWTPALPDAYYWVAPAFSGEIAAYHRLPPELDAAAQSLLAQDRAGSDPGARDTIYNELSRFRYDAVPFILLPHAAATVYQQRWVDNWLFNAADPLPYYYAYSREGD